MPPRLPDEAAVFPQSFLPVIPLALVGLPGAGKTTIGKLLSRRLGLPFVDTDHVIEEKIGGSIRAYFEQQGEDAFRDVEQAVIEELTAAGHQGVLATGGGAVLREANRKRLRESSYVIYLRTSADQVFSRVRHDRKRPLLQVEDPLARLRALYEARDPLYRETAHYVIETGRPSVAALVNKIMMQLELGGHLPLAS